MAATKDPQITTLETIDAALRLIDTKKENLKKAYDDLLSHSSRLLSSPYSLSWSDLDSHFSSVQDNLTARFHLLQSTLEPLDPGAPCHSLLGASEQESPSSSISRCLGRVDPEVSRSELKQSTTRTSNAVDPARSDLMSLCERMDVKGLRKYMKQNASKWGEIRDRLSGAMSVAPDPGSFVLDAMEGFYSSKATSKGDKDPELCRLRRTCLDLLEALAKNKPTFSTEVKERAKKLALEWKRKASLNGESPLEALGFLHLLVAYNLKNEFDVGELVDYFVIVARFRQAIVLCRAIDLGEKTADLIQKLIDSGKLFLAVKFIFEFGLVDKFQPVPLLKAHLKESKKFTNKICQDGKNSINQQNEARSREVNTLKAALALIDEYKLGSEYPQMDLKKRIEMLEKQKATAKNPAASADDEHSRQQKHQPKKQQQQAGNKRPRTSATAVQNSNNGSNPLISPFQQSHLQPASLLLAAGPYGSVGSISPAILYAGPLAGPYGLARAGTGFAGNSGTALAHQYFPESHVQSDHYDRAAAYGGYNFPPKYHPGYYPQ
ncbi:FRIGIDA-LIKE PROTEIN 3-RELATED [Salix purpurea]|uniref:FRIGIDA-like protein n=1 Tax=Salix purpurea TaxID=77065 RepID=A0A9Q0PEN6_SALPP|nr:FRIGIDA-LIKE PROTEIN 3-RELATED [Salix purpurea]